MPYPDQYGRHPWIPSREAALSLAELEKSRYLAWTLRRGEPPRFWDEEYYPDNPGPWPSMLDELRNDTSCGYRLSIIDPPPFDPIKGGFRL